MVIVKQNLNQYSSSYPQSPNLWSEVVVDWENLDISRVHTWISKPFPIQIILIRMTFHVMYGYF